MSRSAGGSRPCRPNTRTGKPRYCLRRPALEFQITPVLFPHLLLPRAVGGQSSPEVKQRDIARPHAEVVPIVDVAPVAPSTGDHDRSASGQSDNIGMRSGRSGPRAGRGAGRSSRAGWRWRSTGSGGRLWSRSTRGAPQPGSYLRGRSFHQGQSCAKRSSLHAACT